MSEARKLAYTQVRELTDDLLRAEEFLRNVDRAKSYFWASDLKDVLDSVEDKILKIRQTIQ